MQQKHKLSSHELLSNTAPVQVVLPSPPPLPPRDTCRHSCMRRGHTIRLASQVARDHYHCWRHTITALCSSESMGQGGTNVRTRGSLIEPQPATVKGTLPGADSNDSAMQAIRNMTAEGSIMAVLCRRWQTEAGKLCLAGLVAVAGGTFRGLLRGGRLGAGFPVECSRSCCSGLLLRPRHRRQRQSVCLPWCVRRSCRCRCPPPSKRSLALAVADESVLVAVVAGGRGAACWQTAGCRPVPIWTHHCAVNLSWCYAR